MKLIVWQLSEIRRWMITLEIGVVGHVVGDVGKWF